MRRDVDSSSEKGYRQLIALLVVAFVITLGVVIGLRMSSDAIAVLTGVIAGVAASIPTALLLMAVTRRREEEEEPEWYPEPSRRPSPPVIVVAPGNMPQTMANYQPSYPSYPAPLPQPSPRREFRVMGYDDEEEAQPVEVEGEVRSWYR